MSASAFVESERVRASLASRDAPMVAPQRRAELIVGGGFVAAAGTLALLSTGNRGISLPLVALYVVSIAVLSRLRFDLGAGFTVPTEVLFVPMLFALPAALVPLLVALALGLGMAPAILRGHKPVSGLLTVPTNSWFALGPALVLTLAHDTNPGGRSAILICALLAQLLCDFVANAALERLMDGLTVRELAAEVRQAYLIDMALAPLGLLTARAAVSHPRSVLLIAPLFGVLRFFSHERQVRLEQMIELNDAYRGTALVLGDVLEAKDSYTGEHTMGVVQLALHVAGLLDLDLARKRRVEFGALLHDVGKIAIPKEIIDKPGALDPQEWALIKTHTIEGQKLLLRVGGFMSEVGEIVRASHERWDGAGYPDGLRSEEIPLEARIVACCDAFDAMTTNRSYRRAMPVSAALAELADNAGTQFDPHVVAALTRVVKASLQRGAAQPPGALPDAPANSRELPASSARMVKEYA